MVRRPVPSAMSVAAIGRSSAWSQPNGSVPSSVSSARPSRRCAAGLTNVMRCSSRPRSRGPTSSRPGSGSGARSSGAGSLGQDRAFERQRQPWRRATRCPVAAERGTGRAEVTMIAPLSSFWDTSGATKIALVRKLMLDPRSIGEAAVNETAVRWREHRCHVIGKRFEQRRRADRVLSQMAYRVHHLESAVDDERHADPQVVRALGDTAHRVQRVAVHHVPPVDVRARRSLHAGSVLASASFLASDQTREPGQHEHCEHDRASDHHRQVDRLVANA